MDPLIRKPVPSTEFMTPERCSILENWNDERDANVSIAQARVTPGMTTRLHHLRGVVERYLVVSGSGIVRIGDLAPERLEPGDVAIIPAGVSQQIRNDQNQDLIFYCICTPRFRPECYEDIGERQIP